MLFDEQKSNRARVVAICCKNLGFIFYTFKGVFAQQPVQDVFSRSLSLFRDARFREYSPEVFEGISYLCLSNFAFMCQKGTSVVREVLTYAFETDSDDIKLRMVRTLRQFVAEYMEQSRSSKEKDFSTLLAIFAEDLKMVAGLYTSRN